MVMLIACEPCRQRKRKCDRAVPSCGLCTRQARPCFYPPHRLARNHDEAQTLPVAGQPDAQRDSQLWELTANHLYQSWALQSPDVPVSYPVTARAYMPRLLRQFCEGLGVSRLPVAVNSTAYHIQTLWLQGAMSDACLFHSTLYAGSSHLDLQRGQSPSSTTLYHQSEAIRLLNDRLSDAASASDDRTIVAVSPLAMFADLNGDRAAADIHRRGMLRLAQMRGGLDKLGYNGLVATLVQMNNIVYNIVFDLDPHLTNPDRVGRPPLGVERRILSPSAHASALPCHSLVLDMFRDVENFKLKWPDKPGYDYLQAYTGGMPSAGFDDPIFHCCYLSVLIFRTIVDNRPRPLSFSAKLDAVASELQASLAVTDPELWIRRIPAVCSWVCLTGAAAASNPRARIWFYFRQASAVRILNVRTEPPFLDELWAHYFWLRRIRLDPVQYAMEVDCASL
ncbi:hypothetical protein BDW62DRAFT_209060 [Aspergillus aurantiobrunneus]